MSWVSSISMMPITLPSTCTTADLVNLEDMLQNGTVISETMIEKPHSFSTACNIATQIIAQVASSISTAVRVFPWPIWHRLSMSAVKKYSKSCTERSLPLPVLQASEKTMDEVAEMPSEKRGRAGCPDDPVSGDHSDDRQTVRHRLSRFSCT